jgi:hypothetical protein
MSSFPKMSVVAPRARTHWSRKERGSIASTRTALKKLTQYSDPNNSYIAKDHVPPADGLLLLCEYTNKCPYHLTQHSEVVTPYSHLVGRGQNLIVAQFILILAPSPFASLHMRLLWSAVSWLRSAMSWLWLAVSWLWSQRGADPLESGAARAVSELSKNPNAPIFLKDCLRTALLYDKLAVRQEPTSPLYHDIQSVAEQAFDTCISMLNYWKWLVGTSAPDGSSSVSKGVVMDFTLLQAATDALEYVLNCAHRSLVHFNRNSGA